MFEEIIPDGEVVKRTDYIMTHESVELDRLNSQHAALSDFMGTLLVCPIDLINPGLRILDLATPNGLWLQDLKSATEACHQYRGTDITNEMFLKDLPSSSTLTTLSSTEPRPSNWPGSFDLVHERFSLASSGQTPVRDVVTHIIDLVKPGGWMEFVEADMTGESNPTGIYMAQFGRLAESVSPAMDGKFDFAL